MYSASANGIVQHGESIERQAISLKGLSGGMNDSLVFMKQDIMFTGESFEIKYPATMSSMWVAAPKFNTDFSLTIAAYGLNKAPGQRRSMRGDNYSVVGWGKMKVKNKNGMATEYIDVLQVKLERTITDSFYINGSPAPPALLMAFGLTQGQVARTYEMLFLRVGEYRPLVKIAYTNSTYTKITYAEVHKQRLGALSGIGNIASTSLDVYPNPVTGHSFSIKGDNLYGKKLIFTLCNTMGQVVTTAEVPTNGIVNLSETIPSGIYHLQLNDGNNIIGNKKLHIGN